MRPIEKLQRKKPVVPFTSERKNQFLELFRSHPDLKGCRGLCAEAVGVSMSAVYDHLKRDPEFAEAFEDALQAFIDENMLVPALKRARDGVERPIIGGRWKDEIITYERVFSDSLMLQMLRAHRPEFRDGKEAAAASMGTTGTGGVLIVPSAPETLTQWQERFGELATGSVGKPKGDQ